MSMAKGSGNSKFMMRKTRRVLGDDMRAGKWRQTFENKRWTRLWGWAGLAQYEGGKVVANLRKRTMDATLGVGWVGSGKS